MPALRKKTDLTNNLTLHLKECGGKKLNPKLGVVTKYRAQKITGKKCKINKMDRPLARLTKREDTGY